MKLILFLLIVVYTEVLVSKKVSIGQMEKGLTATISTSKHSKNGVSSFSFENNKKGNGKPVRTYLTLDLTLLARNKTSTRGYSSQQEYVNTRFDSGPQNPNNSTEKYNINHWGYSMSSKLSSNFVKRETTFRLQSTRNHPFHGRRKINSAPVSVSGKGRFWPKLFKKTYTTNSLQSSLDGKRIKRRALEITMPGLEVDRTNLTNSKIHHLPNITDGNTGTTTGIKTRILEDLSKKGPRSTSMKKSLNFKTLTSRVAKNISNKGIPAKQKNRYTGRKKKTSTAKRGKNINPLPEPVTMVFKYGISEESKRTLRKPRNPSDTLIAPDYEPVNNVLLNPDISQIIKDNPSKEINLKTLKKFKPLITDYDIINSLSSSLKYIEETDEEFDWYQTDDLYEPTASAEMTKGTEISENGMIGSTPSAFNNVYFTTYEDDIPMFERNDVDKKIMVLGVQHTPNIKDKNQVRKYSYKNHNFTSQGQKTEDMFRNNINKQEDENVTEALTFPRHFSEFEEIPSTQFILETKKEQYFNDAYTTPTASSNTMTIPTTVDVDTIWWNDLLKSPEMERKIEKASREYWINWGNMSLVTESDLPKQKESLDPMFKINSPNDTTKEIRGNDYFGENTEIAVIWPMGTSLSPTGVEEPETFPPFFRASTKPNISTSSLETESRISTFITESTPSEKKYEPKLTKSKNIETLTTLTTYIILNESLKPIINGGGTKKSSMWLSTTSSETEYSKEKKKIENETIEPKIAPTPNSTTKKKTSVSWEKTKEDEGKKLLTPKNIQTSKYLVTTDNQLEEMDKINNLHTTESVFSSFESVEDQNLQTINSGGDPSTTGLWPIWNLKYPGSFPPILVPRMGPISAITSSDDLPSIIFTVYRSSKSSKKQIPTDIKTNPKTQDVKKSSYKTASTTNEFTQAGSETTTVNMVTSSGHPKAWPMWMLLRPAGEFNWPLWLQPVPGQNCWSHYTQTTAKTTIPISSLNRKASGKTYFKTTQESDSTPSEATKYVKSVTDKTSTKMVETIRVSTSSRCKSAEPCSERCTCRKGTQTPSVTSPTLKVHSEQDNSVLYEPSKHPYHNKVRIINKMTTYDEYDYSLTYPTLPDGWHDGDDYDIQGPDYNSIIEYDQRVDPKHYDPYEDFDDSRARKDSKDVCFRLKSKSSKISIEPSVSLLVFISLFRIIHSVHCW